MVYPVTGWIKVNQYDDKRAISIANLVKILWLYRYSRPMEIMYDQGSEFIGREFRKTPIEINYGITAKPSTVGNPNSNVTLEHINQVTGNLVQTLKTIETYVVEKN